MASKRRKAREIALKVLYQHDLVGNAPEKSFDLVVSEELFRPIVESFVSEVSIQRSGLGDVNSPDGYSLSELVEDVLGWRNDSNFESLLNEAALKACPEKTIAKNLSDKIIGKIESNKSLEAFARELVFQTSANLAKIDEILVRFADNWSLDRMASLDRSILRFAVCELLYFKEIPINVTINEAIELAKKYSTERSREFINGILDKVQREFKPEKNDPRDKVVPEKDVAELEPLP